MSKIAIIEDDAAIRHMYRMKFESTGYTVQVAENGKLGLELVESMKPDMILLDLMMPIMDGEAVLKELRAQPWGKNIKVIILTNVGENEAPASIKDLGVEAFILKANMTPRQVTQLVSDHLGESA